MKYIQQGLKSNWKQFTLLIVVNAFVGGMIGMERSILPEYAKQLFGIDSHTALLTFIIAFGITKAIANYIAGKLSNQFGRKRLLLTGWWIAIPVPLLLIWAQDWSWVIVANAFLGISQGLTWSSTVLMKIDLVGDKDRGLAMGLNEFAGYIAVGLMAFTTGIVANAYGVVPYPFLIGLGLAIAGLILTYTTVEDTTDFVKQETKSNKNKALKQIFLETTFTNKTLSSVTQAGLVNNLNDGMIWGLLPILLIYYQYNLQEIGIITAIYPMVWGISQLLTGKLADHYSKKTLLFIGMFLQGIVLMFFPFWHSFYVLVFLSFLLGVGTALVYPTFLATIADATRPEQRGESIGTFRLWRDLGYAIGAIMSGIVADQFGIVTAIVLIGGLTMTSAIVLLFRMPDDTLYGNTCLSVKSLMHQLRVNPTIVIVDVRTEAEYLEAHIPSAIHLPIEHIEMLPSLARHPKKVVTVCTKGGGRSAVAALKLKKLGLNAVWLCGGTMEWMSIYKE